jgi:hypothetical protein
VVVELVLEGVTRTARPGSGRIAALDHEVRNDAVEDDAFVKPSFTSDEVRDCLRRVVRKGSTLISP